MMLERGAEVSHEAIRLWCLMCGAKYARRLRRRRGHSGDIWHLDEVFCKINSKWSICGARSTRAVIRCAPKSTPPGSMCPSA